MGHPHYSSAEIAARGEEIYEKQLKSWLELQHLGEYLVIDIETGEYEMDVDEVTASLKAFNKKPKGARFGMRIGYATSGTIGNTLTSAVK